MARVVQPLGGVEATGSVGGLTYYRQRGQTYVRPRVGPGTYQTQPQIDARAVTSALAQLWPDLDQSQRDAWTSSGLPGRTGIGRFIRSNWYLWHVLTSYNPGPPEPTPIPSLGPLSVDVVGEGILCRWTVNPAVPESAYAVDIRRHGPLANDPPPKISYAVHVGYATYEVSHSDEEFVAAPGRGIYIARAWSLSTGLRAPWERINFVVPPW